MIEATDLVKTYGAGASATAALRGVSLIIDDGGFVAILGPSGSGKSTLLSVLSGLERPDSGRVSHDGTDIVALSDRDVTAFRRREVGFVFQQYYLLAGLTVEANVAMGANLVGNGDYRQIIAAIGLADKLDREPSELSGGEQQRVSIARALAKKPNVLFLDEPTGALDEATGRQIMGYIADLHAELGFTAVMVTHNANLAEMAGTVITMGSGQIVSSSVNAHPKTASQIAW